MDPDQTAPVANSVDRDQSDLDPHCLSKRLQIWFDKTLNFRDMRFKG